jgi:hypothetical protein
MTSCILSKLFGPVLTSNYMPSVQGGSWSSTAWGLPAKHWPERPGVVQANLVETRLSSQTSIEVTETLCSPPLKATAADLPSPLASL